MKVRSSTEMGAPGASHLGTEYYGPKPDRSRPRSVLVNGLPSRDLPQLVDERPIANASLRQVRSFTSQVTHYQILGRGATTGLKNQTAVRVSIRFVDASPRSFERFLSYDC
jgi:hypothetical protein